MLSSIKEPGFDINVIVHPGDNTKCWKRYTKFWHNIFSQPMTTTNVDINATIQPNDNINVDNGVIQQDDGIYFS